MEVHALRNEKDFGGINGTFYANDLSDVPKSIANDSQFSRDSQGSDHIERVESRSSHHSVIVDEPPDGGLTAWLQVLAAFMCNWNSWGVVTSFGEFQEYYSHNLLKHESAFRISWIGCLTVTLTFMGSIFFGALADAGYQQPLLIAAVLTQCFALMMLSLCDSYWQVILCQGLLYGIGASISFLCGMGTVPPWFSKKRTLAMGCAVVGSSIGGTVYSAAIHKMLPEIGFGWTLRVLGFIVLGTGLVPPIVIKPRLPPRKRGAIVALECLKEPDFMMFCLGSFLSFSGFYQFYFYYQSWGSHVDPASTVLSYLTAIMNACSIVGRLAPSILVPKLGAFNSVVLTDILSAALSFGWMGATSRGSVLAVGTIYAMVSGPTVVMPPIIVTMLTKNLSRLGIRMSFSFVIIGSGCLVGAPFTGMLVRSYGWVYGQLFCALTWILGAICLIISRQLHVRGKVFVVA